MSVQQSFGRKDCEWLSRDVLYQGRFTLASYTLRHKLFEGGWTESFKREVFERASAAAILPYDPVLDRVILIEQFRAGALADPDSPWLIEIPAGIIELNEQPNEVATRELKEEAGCDLQHLQLIFDYFVSPGGSNEYLYLFCGHIDAGAIEGIHGLKDEQEDIRVINISSSEAFAAMHAGLIKNAPTLLALMWLQLNKGRLQTMWK